MAETAIDRHSGTALATRTLHTPITLQKKRASAAWVGDYTGLRMKPGVLYAAFADNATGTSHVRSP